jgi:hypothetical protein
MSRCSAARRSPSASTDRQPRQGRCKDARDRLSHLEGDRQLGDQRGERNSQQDRRSHRHAGQQGAVRRAIGRRLPRPRQSSGRCAHRQLRLTDKATVLPGASNDALKPCRNSSTLLADAMAGPRLPRGPASPASTADQYDLRRLPPWPVQRTPHAPSKMQRGASSPEIAAARDHVQALSQ